MNSEKGEAVWAILCLVFGLVATVVFTSSLAIQLGWSRWIVFILLFLDVALVLNLPLSIKDHYAMFRLQHSAFPSFGGSPLGLLVMVLAFDIAPILLFLWFASFIF
ncbi:MAG: hypothetical protein A2V81_04420 [Candidatus Abawacabacteria bacterium RBG_16_42_10]|uniref:Uncharacterized protein n=1 Tax=Candidatus Abawacabacteria bacterium RBG_16_42_10 TaxID=1817814 RepID=A0A1F4XIK7_9BACT|nr:MAG: hypothetical protein A2V81_04420 [Candidatus Abawacabacteria bacterium RBG_16_42_10]